MHGVQWQFGVPIEGKRCQLIQIQALVACAKWMGGPWEVRGRSRERVSSKDMKGDVVCMNGTEAFMECGSLEYRCQ